MYDPEKDKNSRFKHNRKILYKFYNLKDVENEDYYNMVKNRIDKSIEKGGLYI